jgi:hypothetical protein
MYRRIFKERPTAVNLPKEIRAIPTEAGKSCGYW